MIIHMEPDLIHELFQNDPDYDFQTTIAIEYRLQFLFLAVINRLHVPLIIRSLIGNWEASCRDTDKIL